MFSPKWRFVCCELVAIMKQGVYHRKQTAWIRRQKFRALLIPPACSTREGWKFYQPSWNTRKNLSASNNIVYSNKMRELKQLLTQHKNQGTHNLEANFVKCRHTPAFHDHSAVLNDWEGRGREEGRWSEKRR